MTATKKALVCSKMTTNTVPQAELGSFPLETKRDVTKLKGQYKVRSAPKKSFSATADRAVRESVAKRRSGTK